MADGVKIKDVNNILSNINDTAKIPVSSGTETEPQVVTAGGLKGYINTGMQAEIDDLSTIRSGAALGATAVQSESDPTVPSWAKAEQKPSYTASEVGAVPTTRTVNGKALSENISLTASDVGALPSNTELFSGSYSDLTNKPTIPSSLSDLSDDSTHRVVTDTEKSTWSAKSDFSGSYNDLTDKPPIPAAQVQSDWSESDNTKVDYIKNKPTLGVGSSSGVASSSTIIGIPAGGNAGQVLYKVDGSTDYSVGWTNQTMNYPSAYCTTSGSTAAKKASCTLYAAQANSYLHVLIGSTNTYAGALTLNVNLEGAKPIYINGAASSATNYTLPKGTYIVFYDGTNYYFRTDGKIEGLQETLVSGTNIKTINNTSLLGSGNISISGGSGDVNVIESITFNGDAVAVDSSKNAAITYTAPVTSVNGNTGAVTISTGDTNVIEGIKLDGESSSLTPASKVVTIPSMGASGSNHRGGLVPDPGSTSGTTKYLREDGSWQTPPDTNTTYSASDFDIKDLADSTSLMSAWSGKQDALSSQTAYTSQGSATKVPQITTNSLGQVTGITEVTITQPDVSNFISTSSTMGLVKNDGSIDTNTYLTSSDLSGYVQTSSTTGLLKNDGTVDTTAYTTNTGTVTSTGGTVAVNNIQVVSALPASPDANTLYLIPET